MVEYEDTWDLLNANICISRNNFEIRHKHDQELEYLNSYEKKTPAHNLIEYLVSILGNPLLCI